MPKSSHETYFKLLRFLVFLALVEALDAFALGLDVLLQRREGTSIVFRHLLEQGHVDLVAVSLRSVCLIVIFLLLTKMVIVSTKI